MRNLQSKHRRERAMAGPPATPIQVKELLELEDFSPGTPGQ